MFARGEEYKGQEGVFIGQERGRIGRKGRRFRDRDSGEGGNTKAKRGLERSLLIFFKMEGVDEMKKGKLDRDVEVKKSLGLDMVLKMIDGTTHNNSFYKVDLELSNLWYKTQIFELYLTMNLDEKDPEDKRQKNRWDSLKQISPSSYLPEVKPSLIGYEDKGLRNANHTQTLDLADIYERYVYEDNLIQIRYSNTKKSLITTPSSNVISTTFFSNNVIHDFQENSNDEVDERSSEEYLRDLDIEFHERALLENLKHFIKRRNNFYSQKANENTECYKCGNKGHFAKDCFSKTSEPSYKSPVTGYSSVLKGFQPKFTPKLIQSSQNSSSQANLKNQKDYKVEYKKTKAKLALLEASPPTPQNPKAF
ncbi:retrovirus-related pol polyprotein from transposon TNT 1-94 [Tanacetum coccineum]